MTLFGVDIYKQHIKKDATEREIVRAGKMFGVGLAVLAMFIAPAIANAPDGLFGYLQEVNGCYSIPIFTIIVVGYLTKRVPAIAANIGILFGAILYFISQFILKPNMVKNAVAKAEASGADAAAIAIIEKTAYPHFLHVMAILFVLNVAMMLIIGMVRPRPTDYVQEYTEQVDISPWKLVYPVGGVIIAIVVGIYIYFA